MTSTLSIWEERLRRLIEAHLPRWLGAAQRIEASDGWWGVLAALVVILAWRLLRGKRVTRRGGAAAVAEREYPGRDSELYAPRLTSRQRVLD